MSPLQRFPSLLLETVILGIVINPHAAKLKGIDLWIHISYFKKVPLSNRTPQWLPSSTVGPLDIPDSISNVSVHIFPF